MRFGCCPVRLGVGAAGRGSPVFGSAVLCWPAEEESCGSANALLALVSGEKSAKKVVAEEPEARSCTAWVSPRVPLGASRNAADGAFGSAAEVSPGVFCWAYAETQTIATKRSAEPRMRAGAEKEQTEKGKPTPGGTLK